MTEATTGTNLQQLLQHGRPLAGANDPTWLAPLRDRAVEQFAGMRLPQRRDETWRYTTVAFLEEQAYGLLPQQTVDGVSLQDIESLLLPGADTRRLVFINGRLAPHLGTTQQDVEGVYVGNLADAQNIPLTLQGQLDRVATHRHVFATLNAALMTDGALIHVSADTVIEQPIEILHVAVGTDGAAIVHPRHLLVLEEGARASVIERYCSLGDTRHFNNAVIEVLLGKNSTLAHDRAQEESRHAKHLSDLHVQQQAGSRYRLAQMSLGGSWSRTDLRLSFAGEGAHAELDGLILATDQQLNDVHLYIDHAVPNCSSRESFKGVLDGKGRLVFDGHIVVAQDAQKTDALLSNHNLMLSRSAEVDTKPQLEIYADDVKCSHGTTVGELDDDMLFYLRSRGIPEPRARQLLCQGFAEEAIAAISTTALREHVSTLLATRLENTHE